MLNATLSGMAKFRIHLKYFRFSAIVGSSRDSLLPYRICYVHLKGIHVKRKFKII